MTRLPDFLIAGAPRCGSTTLYRMLDQHPSVFMARPKEIGFFNGVHGDDISWYSEHFAGARADEVAGEATPWYLQDPVAVDAMATTVPEARIIVILRDPVDRTYSHYWMARNRGRADVPFEEFLESTPVLSVGRYADHLEYLSGRFARDQILVVFHHELRSAPEDLYANVCRFIGVDDSFVPGALGDAVNQYVEFRSLAVRKWAKGLPSTLGVPKRVIGKLNTKKSAAYSAMRSDTREWLADYFEEPNAELASWLGHDVPSWTQPLKKS